MLNRRNDLNRNMVTAFMSPDNEALWDKNNREQSVAVTFNAQVHHLCLWFLIYGESANLRHTSEVLCYIFHSALCAMTLEDKMPETIPFDGSEPSGDQLVLAKPVEGSDMPYPEDDYLNTVVRPLYQFLQREVQARASAPIVDRVMYDDVNEFFLGEVQGDHASRRWPRYTGEEGWVGVAETMRSLSVEKRLTRIFARF